MAEKPEKYAVALAAINAIPEPRNHIALPLKREALTSDVCITATVIPPGGTAKPWQWNGPRRTRCRGRYFNSGLPNSP